MADIQPFKAVRPTRDKVSLIASRSYQTYTKEERKARLDNNPYSFLHIVNPGYKYKKEISGEQRFKLVRNRYEEFKEDKIFIQEDTPTYYIYKIIDREEHCYTGIVGAASINDYERGIIKKHEKTLRLREELFKEYLKTTGFNAESVLLTYQDDVQLETIFNKVMQERAEYEFTTTYKDTHYLWPVNDILLVEKIQDIFKKKQTIYIADGHHRSSSSQLLTEERRSTNGNHTGYESYNYFMAYLLPESQLRIDGFSRAITDLNKLSKEEFLIALDEFFKIENFGEAYYPPKKKHHFAMYLDGEFYDLHLRKHLINFKDPLQALDAQILFDYLLKPILNIQDLRNDKRLAYGKGKNDMVSIKAAVDKGKYAVGFTMQPPTINEIKAIADANLTMPPKSTYIEPKLRSGVTIYEL